jgi:hypothetical protein
MAGLPVEPALPDVWDIEEERLTEHPRVDELVPAMARKLVNPPPRRRSGDGPPHDQ